MADKKGKSVVKDPGGTLNQVNTKAAPTEPSSSTMLRLSEISSPREKWKVLGSREAIQLLNPSHTPRSGSPGIRLNGRPDLNRTDSLLAPGSKDRLNKSGSDGGDEKGGSRPSSARSGHSALSSLNLSGVPNASANQTKEPKEEEKSKNAVLSTDTDYKSAIPYLPQWLAVLCLIINTIIPGIG
jgi:hypothetical protein